MGFTNGWIQRRGWVEVIVGGMFSGKNEELISRLRRAEYARQKIKVFNPVLATRYSMADVCSHNQNTIQSLPILAAIQVWEHLKA